MYGVPDTETHQLRTRYVQETHQKRTIRIKYKQKPILKLYLLRGNWKAQYLLF